MRGVLYINGVKLCECETTLDADGFRAATESALREVTDRLLVDGMTCEWQLEPEDSVRVTGLFAGIDVARDRFEGPPILFPGLLKGCHRQQFGRRGKGERKRNRRHRWG